MLTFEGEQFMGAANIVNKYTVRSIGDPERRRVASLWSIVSFADCALVWFSFKHHLHRFCFSTVVGCPFV